MFGQMMNEVGVLAIEDALAERLETWVPPLTHQLEASGSHLTSLLFAE